MIEPLLEAERAMSFGLIDQAERLYRQVAQHDPGSSIAVVGLARVCLERGDERTAYLEARRALKIDPDNPAAQHLVMRLGEVFEGRGETLPEVEAPSVTPEPVDDATPAARSAEPVRSADAAAAHATPAAPRPRKRRSALDRLLGRRR
jgi:thioredoxin-like negative regulator of GroEL